MGPVPRRQLAEKRPAQPRSSGLGVACGARRLLL